MLYQIHTEHSVQKEQETDIYYSAMYKTDN